MTRLRRFVCSWLIPVLLMAAANASAVSVAFTYPASSRELVNPYIGNVAWANDTSKREQPFSLVYANLLWSDFEPMEGEYDFDAFEKANHFDIWRKEGKHFILRFVMDQPGKKSHKDIPDWLYTKTGKDGEAYKTTYGRGYNPNYENAVLIEAHSKAIAALGERYGQDPFIAFVELGSLGHWGEWHVHNKLHALPLEEIRNLYVAPYFNAFPNAKLMMRRPFTIAAKNKMGLFNDTSGDAESTETWLNWIGKGGIYDQTGEIYAIVPMGDAWLAAPVGGELSTSFNDTDFLDDKMLDHVLNLFERSHTSWIGPRSFADVERNGKYQKALDQVNRLIGYRLRVMESEVSQTENGAVAITITWVNDGIAPFYFDWVPCLRIVGENRAEVIMHLDMKLSDMQPGIMVPVTLTIEESALPKGKYTVYAGIIDPDTGNAGIELAMDTARDGKWFELLNLTIQGK